MIKAFKIKINYAPFVAQIQIDYDSNIINLISFYFQPRARLLLLVTCFQQTCASVLKVTDDVNDTNGTKLSATATQEEVYFGNILNQLQSQSQAKQAEQAELEFEKVKMNFFLSELKDMGENKIAVPNNSSNITGDDFRLNSTREQRRSSRLRRGVGFKSAKFNMRRAFRAHCGNDDKCSTLGECIAKVTLATAYHGLHCCCQTLKVGCELCVITCDRKLYRQRPGLDQKQC